MTLVGFGGWLVVEGKEEKGRRGKKMKEEEKNQNQNQGD
jgi:hypothetical protein